MIPNRTDLAQIAKMTAKEVANLPTDQLAELLDDLAAMKASAKRIDDKLNDAMGIKFGQRASDLRKAEGKDTGRVSFDDGEFIVRADLPKKVTWDQSGLAEAVRVIREEWKEKATDYVAMEIKVSETKYNAWPPIIQKAFQAARTVGQGKPSFVIERRAA